MSNMLRNTVFRKITLLVLIISYISFIVACNNKTPIEVTTSWNELATAINIQAVVDTVTIQEVKLNRGNIKFNSFLNMSISESDLPRTLKFGESIVVHTMTTGVKEVEVQTDKGTWTFTFN